MYGSRNKQNVVQEIIRATEQLKPEEVVKDCEKSVDEILPLWGNKQNGKHIKSCISKIPL